MPPVFFANSSVQIRPRTNGMISTSTTIDQLLDDTPLTVCWNMGRAAAAPRTIEEPEPPKRANAWHQEVPVLRRAVG